MNAIKGSLRAIGRAFTSIGKAIAKSAIGRAVLQIVACAAGPITCAAAAASLTLAAGGAIKQALLSALIAFAQINVYDFVGGIVQGVENTAGAVAGAMTKLTTHAVVGGAFAVAQGGEFATGAFTGAMSASATVITDTSGVLGQSGDGDLGGLIGRTAITAAAGGSASVLAGGKFANGAVTGAMGHLFNAEGMFRQGLPGAQSGIDEVAFIQRSEGNGIQTSYVLEEFATFVAIPFRAAMLAARGVGVFENSFFQGSRYSQKVLQQMRNQADRFHSFPESVTAFESAGSTSAITGRDGLTRQMLEISGSYGGRNGVFQFIKESDGIINHRLFVPKP